MSRVRDGTPRLTEQSLCYSCKYAMVVTGDRKEIIECSMLAGEYGEGRGQITMKVLKCTKYEDVTTPDIGEMHRIAWIVKADRKGKLGFVQPKDIRKAHPVFRHIVEDD